MTSNDQNSKFARCPAGIRSIIEEFQAVTPRERLEYLLDFSDDLPDLPVLLAGERDSMEQVHECQSPVFLHTDLVDGSAHFYFDVPAESPTVRGYASILQEGFDGASVDEVLGAPDDIYVLLGLNDAISPLRLRGLHALMVYMKRQTERMAG